MDTNDAHVSQTLVEVIAKRGPLKTTAHRPQRNGFREAVQAVPSALPLQTPVQLPTRGTSMFGRGKSASSKAVPMDPGERTGVGDLIVAIGRTSSPPRRRPAPW